MRRALLLALLIAISGCLAPQSGSTDDPAGPAPGHTAREEGTLDGIAWQAPVVLGRLTLGAEPNVAAAPDGTLYVASPLALWRSDDDGASWISVGGESCPTGLPECAGQEQAGNPGMSGGGDGDIVVTADGRLHWLGLGGGIPYQFSEDLGVTWSEAVDASHESGSDREWITVAPNGTLYGAWRSPIQVAWLTPGADDWSDPVEVADDTRQGGVTVAPSNGFMVLPYDVGGQIRLAVSHDGGPTWESFDVADQGSRGHIFPIAAIDGNDTVYVVWAQDGSPQSGAVPSEGARPLDRPNVFLAVSRDEGRTWSEPVALNPEGTSALFPWIAAGGPGNVVVTWLQNDDATPNSPAGIWNVDASISLDADTGGAWARHRITRDPAHIGSLCTSGSFCTLTAQDRSLLDFFEVAIAPDGHPFVAWAQDNEAKQAVVEVAVSRMDAGPDLWGS